jgi:TetR/AcrR family transcriptional regulator
MCGAFTLWPCGPMPSAAAARPQWTINYNQCLLSREVAWYGDFRMSDDPDAIAVAPRTPRMKPGERRVQILQTLAEMLQEPQADRVTTAALAGRIQVSEAALYRHFASKAQMFEGLIEFIEGTLFGLINQITTAEGDGLRHLRQIIAMLLGFAEKNPGMTRLLVGDALVTEDDRLQQRINQVIDRLEMSIKQCFRQSVAAGQLPANTDPAARAGIVIAFVLGRWLRFSKSGFRKLPTESIEQQMAALIL